jgi:hypothetical protein
MSAAARPAHALAGERHALEPYLGRCVACSRPVKGGDTVSWLDGELYHHDCARWRSLVYNGEALEWRP